MSNNINLLDVVTLDTNEVSKLRKNLGMGVEMPDWCPLKMKERAIYMIDNFEYSFDEKLGGIVIKKYTGTSDVVVIPTEIEGYPVVGIGSAFRRCSITQVTIPDSVKFINDGAFDHRIYKDNSFVDTNLGMTVIYKGASYVKTRNENNKYTPCDFPKEFYKALWNGVKYEYCKECPYHLEQMDLDIDKTGWFDVEFDMYCKKAIVDGMPRYTGEPKGIGPKSPDWCPVNESECMHDVIAPFMNLKLHQSKWIDDEFMGEKK